MTTTVREGRAYRITGKTSANLSMLRSIGAQFEDDTPLVDVGVRASGNRYWLLDLTETSKAKFQRSIANTVFKLGRAGCKFEEVDPNEI